MVAMATRSAGAPNWVLTSYAVYRGRLRAAGATALMAAAGRGRDAEVSALLANGADVRLTSLDGSSAAGWASRYHALHSHNSHFQILLHSGIKPLAWHTSCVGRRSSCFWPFSISQA